MHNIVENSTKIPMAFVDQSELTIIEKRKLLLNDLKKLIDTPPPIRNMPEPSDPMAGLLLSQG